MKRIILACIEIGLIVGAFAHYDKLTPEIVMIAIIAGVLTIVYDVLYEIKYMIEKQHELLLSTLLVLKLDNRADNVLNKINEIIKNKKDLESLESEDKIE